MSQNELEDCPKCGSCLPEDKARMRVTAGRLSEALTWVRERGLSVEDNLSYLWEYEHITLAKILIAQYQRDRKTDNIHGVIELLDRLLQAAEAGEQMGSVIEILVVKAIAHQTRGDLIAAIDALKVPPTPFFVHPCNRKVVC